MTASAVQKPADAHIRMLLKTLQISIALKWSYDVYMVSKKFNILTFYRLLAVQATPHTALTFKTVFGLKGVIEEKKVLELRLFFAYI